eukprot:gb/GFBE01075493.1/.p1 GENE.gb/GFBE01075493.1/~~gb/GFBE01075493.1/.p1  ORF type:complete len:361 (+),score=47.57 gb/GFBE01075493.1/:1-1083(+)
MTSLVSDFLAAEEAPAGNFRAPPGLVPRPRCLEELEQAAAAEFQDYLQGYPGAASLGSNVNHGWGDMALEGGFSNIWLWPTDAAMRGSAMPPTFQGMSSRGLSARHVPLPSGYNAGSSLLDGGDAQRSRRAAPAPPGKTQLQEVTVKACCDALAARARAAEEEKEFGKCRWHKSAETVGVISNDGHVFTKTAGPRRSRVSDRGARVELASICMVFDSSLRCGGVHRYCYQIMDGELGAADGAGFVFDSKVRRNNIQRMRSVFLNQRGRICLRNNQQVTKLEAQLPPLTVGVILTLLVDLDSLTARFDISNPHGALIGSADVSLEGLFDPGCTMGLSRVGSQLRSGFFCAVVTGSITIGIH